MTFEDFVRSLGLLPRRPVAPDGKWHRCPTEGKPRRKNGAWKLATDGLIGWAWDCGVHGCVQTWRPDDDAPVQQFDPTRLREAQAEALREKLRATLCARTFYRQCADLRGGHPYLTAHGLDMTGCLGLKVDLDGWLVVPMLIGRQVVSVQRIDSDGTKRFWPGAPTKGTTYTIERNNASITVICEGLATGLAIYAAAPLTRVIVAFTAGGLAALPVRPTGLAVIASDNDHRTVCNQHRTAGLQLPYEPWEGRPTWCRCNPGRVEALAAATALGCGIAIPEGMDGTDWSDWRQERVAKRLAAEPRAREADIRRAVDAQIALEIQKHARFLT